MKINSIKIRRALVFQLLFFSFLGGTTACNRSDSNNVQCNDRTALNFSESASVNLDCKYVVEAKPATLLTQLDSKVKESSGLIYFDGLLLTHNDKGGKNELYVIDSLTGAIIKTFTINGAENVDWEDLAESDEHIFICNTGNNDGNRKDLSIYKLNKADFHNSNSIVVRETIRFSYPDQISFATNKKHNFDCEAVVYASGNLYLFTKNRADNLTVMYMLPAKGGEYKAQRITQFNVNMRVTAADLSPDKSKLVLLGNKDKISSLWVFSDYNGENFFSGKKKQILLGSFDTSGQMEGVVFMNANTLYISNEEEAGVPQSLHKFTLPY